MFASVAVIEPRSIRPSGQRHRFAEIVMPLPFRQLSNHTPRYFGISRTEAEKWIEKHRWLTKQRRVPDENPTQTP
jgi:hypothetical protein